MIKRTICFLMAFLFISSSSFAQDVIFKEITAETSVLSGGARLGKAQDVIIEEAEDFGISFFNTMPFDEYIAEAVFSYGKLPEKITGLSQYLISEQDFADKYFDALLTHPEIPVKTEYEILGVVPGTDIVEYVVPIYMVESIEEAEIARKQIEDGVKEYTSLAASYNTDLEKLIVIHDKMVADCAYDVRVESKDPAISNSVPNSIRHAIGVFRDKKAVCQGYTQALYVIAKALGIEMDICYSEEKSHMWNYVKLDGKWYHMDMTNDDPLLEDEAGNIFVREDTTAYHTYFMVSDGKLIPSIHGTDYRTFSGESYTCNDKAYEENHFFNMLIPFTAERAEDGYFHAYVNVSDEGEGIDTEVHFKSKTLYTGPVIPTYCLADRKYTQVTGSVATEKTEKALYIMAYPTKALENTMVISRYDNKNNISMLKGMPLLKNELLISRVARGVPEGVSMSFTAFVWDADTLVPYAEKTVWTQN